MHTNIFPITSINNKLNSHLQFKPKTNVIYQSSGLKKHIEKRHPECIEYLQYLPLIINDPDYIGVNPNEMNESFELVKIFDKNILIGIKLDTKDDYLYVATLHTITTGKLNHGLENGRLKKVWQGYIIYI